MSTASDSQVKRLVRCPGCGKLAVYESKNQFRPFCSQRCKLTDTAQWASEGYRIPSQLPVDEEESMPTKDLGESD